MRFWVYDDDGQLIRRFYSRDDAERFLQAGWCLRVQPKTIKRQPTVETHGEARW